MNKDRRSTVKKSVFAVIVLLLLIALIGGTYARYSSTTNVSGDIQVAKWAVKVNETDISTASTDVTLDFNLVDGTNVVPDRIAPGKSATAYIEIDLTGTEVSVDFSCVLAENADELKSVFGDDYADKVTVETGTPAIANGATNMTLSADGKYITVGNGAMSGKVTVPITLTWTDRNTTAGNADDSTIGNTADTLSIPVTVTVAQKV